MGEFYGNLGRCDYAFLIMDPLGNIPVFLSVLKNVPESRRLKVLARELLIALVIMLGFLFSGPALLKHSAYPGRQSRSVAVWY